MKKEVPQHRIRLKVTDDGFWGAWFAKLLFTLISLKTWGLITSTAVTTYLLLHDDAGFDSDKWLTFNTTIWCLIYGMKEIVTISDQKDANEKEAIDSHNEAKKDIVGIQANAAGGKGATSASSTTFQPDGTEVVGDEPDDGEIP